MKAQAGITGTRAALHSTLFSPLKHARALALKPEA
jgi:hypothetical protein